MADYYPLIARAVTGLEKSTGEARRALYERARVALVTQLRGVVPALSESDITRERLALEEAIRKVEGEAARRSRSDAPAPEPAPPSPPPPPPPPRPTPPTAEPKPFMPGPSAYPPQSPYQPSSDHPAVPERPFTQEEERQESQPRAASPPEPRAPEPSPRIEPVMPGRTGSQAPGDRSSMFDQALKGFREVVAGDRDHPGAADGEGSKPPRGDEFAGQPPASSDRERIEPQFPMAGLGPARREPAALKAVHARQDAGEPPRTPPPPQPSPSDVFEEPQEDSRLRPGMRGVVWKIAAIALVVALGVAAAFAYKNSDKIVAYYQSMRGPATQAAKDTTQARPKISDRIGSAGQQDSATPNAAGTAVAQRVVLYEQQPNTTERKQYIGSVIWRTEMGSSGPGSPPDLALKADVEIPERQLRMTWTMRRNADAALPASHTIEILFNPAPGFPPGGIADMANVLMEQADHSSGVPLNGIRVKAAPGFFLVGLSAVPADVQRNTTLLKERPWLDIAIIYNDGNRALLALEKGVPGDRVFGDAFKAWGQ
jgi:hypothetical protein